MVGYLKKTEGSEGFHQIVDFLNTSHIRYALTKNLTIYVSLIQQFWQTATTRTLDNGEMEIIATIDGKVKTLTKASIRKHLKLEDSDGISNLPNTKIFKQLALMGVDIPLFPTMLVQGLIFQGKGSTVLVESHHTPTGAPSTSQPHFSPKLRSSIRQETELIKKVKRLEKKDKLSKSRRKARIVVLNDEEDLEDPSKQGRKITKIDQDPDISLVQHDTKFNFDFSAAKEVSTAKEHVTEEREKYNAAEQARMLSELINQRKRYFAAQRPEQKRNKLPIQAQRRTYMSNYIKHIGSHTLQQLRSYSFDEIKTLFETTMRRVNIFVPIESEVDREVFELAAGSSKRDAEEELDKETSKRQKTGESSELAEEPRDKEVDELSQEELQQMIIIVLEQGMNVEALQTKYPIINWEIYIEGTRKYRKIIQVGNHTEVHHFFNDMLKAFDRDDLVMLWSLVKEKFNSTKLTDDKEREIWVELKRLFEPDINGELWKLQKHIHDLTWKLYDSCGVNHVSTEKGIDIYMLVEKEYPLSRGTLTLMLVAKLLVEQDNEMSRELRKIFMQAERTRR
ncbi:hypothetical protein Tco_1024516 [Tanacetum coccineum]